MKQAMKRAVIAVVFTAFAIDVSAQTALDYQAMWNQRIEEVKKLRDAGGDGLVLNIGKVVSPLNNNISAFLLFAYAQNLTREVRLMVEAARTDKQLGSPAASAGSTSLVSRAAAPSIFGFAVEHGALTQAANETSATLRGNAIGWLDLLKEQDFVSSYDDDSRFIRALRRISYSFTFNTAPGETAAAAERPDPGSLKEQLEEAGRQLSSYSVRLTLVDQRDPRRRDNRAAVATFVDNQGPPLLAAAAFLDPVFLSPEYDRWLEETQAILSAPGSMSKRDIERILYRRLETLRQMMAERLVNFEDDVAAYVNALNAFESSRTVMFAKMQKKFVMAAELVRVRPSEIPASSTYRLVAEGRPGGGAWNITGNAALTRQDAGTVLLPEPTETSGWRDFQVAVQAERTLGRVNPCEDAGVGRPALALEYLLQRLHDNAVVTFAGFQYPVQKGVIHAAQAKLTIPMKNSGIKVPLSVSIANRTELLKEKTVRGHIGLTFDLDVLASAVRR
jgi:hypothetical protein